MPRKSLLLLSAAMLAGCSFNGLPMIDQAEPMAVVTPQHNAASAEELASLEANNDLPAVTPKATSSGEAPAIPSPDAPSRAPTAMAATAQDAGPLVTAATAIRPAPKPGPQPVAVAAAQPKPVEVPNVITGAPAPAPKKEPEADKFMSAEGRTGADALNAAQIRPAATPAPVAAPVPVEEPVEEPAPAAPVAMAAAEPQMNAPQEVPQVISGEAAAHLEAQAAPRVIASTQGAAAPAPADDEVMHLLAAERVVASVNAYRAENGLAPLAYNEGLSDVAEAHVLELAARGEVTALNAEGQGIGERLAAVGMTPEVAGSLVSGGYTNFENALASWKANPVQRSRLLIEGAKEVGFGVVSDRTSTYGIYMELIITGDES
ncbi:CAP domain-containing protein [Parvularcula marina]|uniref:CAP domain-containing protein n=1 Tax=Parvularcula marina TaxID=2292771 RepID=UPI0035122682